MSRIVAVIAGLALVFGLVAYGEAEAKMQADGDYRLKVVTHNIAGGPLHNGAPRVKTDTTARPPRVALATVEWQMDNWSPDIVMLQEVCETQLAALRADYPTWNIKFVPMRDPHTACTHDGTPNAQGQVLASPHPMGAVTVHDLGHDDGDKNFTLLCAPIDIPGPVPVRGCVTHLRVNATDPTGEHKTALLENIADITAVWSGAGWEVVVAGDFNAGSMWDSMNSIYRLTKNHTLDGRGRFYEADQTDPEWCPNVKPCRYKRGIDHIFFSKSRATPTELSGGFFETDLSDHPLFRGWADIN